MRLNVATNWDRRLYEELAGLPVGTYYGKLREDIVGGGRPSHLLPEVSRAEVAQQVKLIHQQGAEFNYVLNSACLGNREYQDHFKRELFELLGWLVDIGTDMVSVAVPYLIEIIKNHFPSLKVSASIFCHIDNLHMAQFYEQLGVDEITLLQSLTRLPSVLKSYRQALKVDLQVIVNNACLFGCPYRRYHSNINSHSSQCDYEFNQVNIDYPVLNCTQTRLMNPAEIIRSPWIRPEDLHYLEEVGIDKFKIAGRTKSTEWLIKVTKAYAERRSGANTASVINFPHGSGAAVSGLGENFPTVDIFIDNARLDGYFEFFLDKNCRELDCRKCRYCDQIASKTVLIDEEARQQVLKTYEQAINKLQEKI